MYYTPKKLVWYGVLFSKQLRRLQAPKKKEEEKKIIKGGEEQI